MLRQIDQNRSENEEHESIRANMLEAVFEKVLDSWKVADITIKMEAHMETLNLIVEKFGWNFIAGRESYFSDIETTDVVLAAYESVQEAKLSTQQCEELGSDLFLCEPEHLRVLKDFDPKVIRSYECNWSQLEPEELRRSLALNEKYMRERGELD